VAASCPADTPSALHKQLVLAAHRLKIKLSASAKTSADQTLLKSLISAHPKETTGGGAKIATEEK
jgi:hypothetical protein